MQTENSIIFYCNGTVLANQIKFTSKCFVYHSKTGNKHSEF